MEQNILRALHKNFLPKEMQEHFDNYLNWEHTSCEVITGKRIVKALIETSSSVSDQKNVVAAFVGCYNPLKALGDLMKVSKSIQALLEFMLTNNIQVILND